MLQGHGYRKAKELEARRERQRRQDGMMKFLLKTLLFMAVFMAGIELGRREERASQPPVEEPLGNFPNPTK